MEEIIRLSVELFFAVVGVIMSAYLLPWLREKRIYSLIKLAVKGAEKLAETVCFV